MNKKKLLSILSIFLILISIIDFNIRYVYSDSSQISYTTGQDSEQSFYNMFWDAQTFTTTLSITVTQVKVYIRRSSTHVGTITLSIRATDVDHKPTGPDLTSATKAMGDVGSTFDWYVFDVTDYVLSSTTQYALQLKCTSIYNDMKWGYDITSSPYSGGDRTLSTNSGSTWTIYPDTDFLFDIWGDVYAKTTNKAMGATTNQPFDEQYFYLNSTIEVIADVSTLDTVKLYLDYSSLNLTIQYDNVTNTFSKLIDSNNYLQLDSGSSSKTQLNSTFIRINFKIKLHYNVTKDGYYDVRVFSNETTIGASNIYDFNDVFNLTMRKSDCPEYFYGAGFNASSPYIELYWFHDMDFYEYFNRTFQLKKSTDNSTWSQIYSGLNLSFNYTTGLNNGTKVWFRLSANRQTGTGWHNSSCTYNFEKIFFIKSISGNGSGTPINDTEPYTINIKVIDVNYSSIENAEVKFINSTYTFIDFTNSSGYVTAQSLYSGYYVLFVEKDGFQPYSYTVNISKSITIYGVISEMQDIYVFIMLIIVWLLCLLALRTPLFGFIGFGASIVIFIFVIPLITDSLIIGLIYGTLFTGVITGLLSAFIVVSKW